MNHRILGIALLVGGLVALAFGLSASDSIGSDLSRAFTGNPTDKAIWLIISGAVATAAGLFMATRNHKV